MSPSNRDRIAGLPLALAALTASALILLIVAFLLRESGGAFAHAGFTRFFTDPSWHPAADAARGTFNLAPMIAGTLLAALGAVLIAAPLGLLCAVFCHDYAPRALAVLTRRIVELLAGIPSVVYGLWGLVVLVPLIRLLAPPGPSLLAAMLILALMILPTVAVLADAALAAVPRELRQAAAALGLSRARTVWSVVVPAARAGISGGVLLAAGRAVGETLAVLMVCGNVVQVPASFFDPVRTLTANIALEMAYATDDHRSALFVSGLALTAMVMLLVLLAQRADARVAHG
ncbi:MAG: phosphate ABC transporter permease subunit PstC [Panacagrimonas sp.]